MFSYTASGVASTGTNQEISRPFARVGLVFLSGVIVIGLALVGSNWHGWRARVIARLFRTDNDPIVVAAPADFKPTVPAGFNVSIFANGFKRPRWLAVAPNGDIFVADSGAGEVVVLHESSKDGSNQRETFADHLDLPFGVAFHDDYVYVANTNEVVRFLYNPATSKRLGDAEHILDLPGLGYNQHWTRSLAFNPDGKKLFVSVGSHTNVSVESDPRRAAILVADPDGKNMRVYAAGLRNAVGIKFNPQTGQLWATVNERDDLGEDVPADFFTHVVDGGFYGWPYAYSGKHVDNRVPSRPDLVERTISPDLLLGPHVAPLQFVFYEKQQFPTAYWHGAFIAEHGSWNRRSRTGYQVVFVPFREGVPAGEPQTFFSGFVPDALGKNVYGRMVGVAVTTDGSLLISDDGANVIWRVWYDKGSPGADGAHAKHL
jgi:glucose/arabinose dehydrogenase